MRGHVEKKRGRYYVVVELDREPQTGGRRRKGLGGYRTRKEATAVLTDALSRAQQGAFVEPSRQTVGQFLEEWLPAIRSTVRASTWDSYRSNVETHIIPALGLIPLRRLSPGHVNAFYTELLIGGRKDGKGLSPRTVAYIGMIIHRALKDAERWGRVSRNVAELADRPKPRGTEMRVWTGQQLRTFLSHLEGNRLYTCFLMAATTGMRRGELLGLRWQDVDLDAGRLQIRQTLVVTAYRLHFSEPKTKRSRRSISLDPATLTAIKSHRSRKLEERLAWGPGYEESGLVFTREDGAPLHPQHVSDAFERHVRAAGLPVIRFHDLRHTYATIALSAGTHPKVVSERLGHSSISITLDTYSHVIPALSEQEANRIASLILDG